MGRNIKVGTSTLSNVETVSFPSADDPTYQSEFYANTELIRAMFQDTGKYVNISAVVDDDGAAILYTDWDMSTMSSELEKPYYPSNSCICVLMNENWDSVNDSTLFIWMQTLGGKPYYSSPTVYKAVYTTVYNIGSGTGTTLYTSEYPNEDTGLYSICKMTATNYANAWNADGEAETKRFHIYHLIPPMRHLNYTLDDTTFDDGEVVVDG